MPSNAELGVAISTSELSVKASEDRFCPSYSLPLPFQIFWPKAPSTVASELVRHIHAPDSTGRTSCQAYGACPGHACTRCSESRHRNAASLPCHWARLSCAVYIAHRTTSADDLSSNSRAAAISSALYPCHRGS